MQDTHRISEAVAPSEQEKLYKESWYSTLKQNPEALAYFNENTKENMKLVSKLSKSLQI